MKEIDMRVKDSDLALTWFKYGLFSLNEAIDSIEDLNTKYGFNLKDRNEELPLEKNLAKMSIKYNNVCIPIASALEHMMKAVLIADKYVNDRANFNRENVVFDIMRNVRNSYRRNGHDFEALIRYIESTIDSNFSQKVGANYAAIRGDTRFYDTRLSPNSAFNFATPKERIDAATQEYTQGFIEFRYLFEKDEQFLKNVDLIKLIHYALAIQETCLGLLKRLRLVSSLETSTYMLASAPKKSLKTQKEEESKKVAKEALDILIEEALKKGVNVTELIQELNRKLLQQVQEHSTIDKPTNIPLERSILLEYGVGIPPQEVQRQDTSIISLREELEMLFENNDKDDSKENVIKL